MKTALAVILGSMLSAVSFAALSWAGELSRTTTAPADSVRKHKGPQLCLLGATSCLDMDPRSFELCLAGAERCDQSYSVDQLQLAEIQHR